MKPSEIIRGKCSPQRANPPKNAREIAKLAAAAVDFDVILQNIFLGTGENPFFFFVNMLFFCIFSERIQKKNERIPKIVKEWHKKMKERHTFRACWFWLKGFIDKEKRKGYNNECLKSRYF